MSGAGDCFQAALRTAAELRQGGLHPLVVHGLPVGRGGDVAGLRYWHAWVEVEAPDATRGGKPTWSVCDWSNGQQRIFIARTVFYRLGKVQQHLLWRYSPDEVRGADGRARAHRAVDGPGTC